MARSAFRLFVCEPEKERRNALPARPQRAGNESGKAPRIGKLADGDEVLWRYERCDIGGAKCCGDRNPADSLNPAWKTGNYLNNILGLREARARGADEAVMTNHAGEITEAAVSNIGFVQGGEVVTPPLSAGILGGVTRHLVLAEIAGRVGLKARETTVRPADFGRLEECFLMSTTRDISPVARIDGTPFRVASDSITARLKAAFADFARAYATAHPELKI